MTEACEIAPDATIELTLFRSLVETQGERGALVWSDLVEMFREPRRLAAVGLQRTDDGRFVKPRDLAGYAPATFRGDKRSLENVERVSALLLDYDDGATSQADALAAWAGFAAFAHSTFNSRADAPRFRIELQLSRSVTRDEHAILWKWARARVAAAGHVIDEATKDASRFWFSPVMPDDAEYEFAVLDGAPLDVDAILASVAAESAAPTPSLRLVTEPDSIPMADRERRARAYADKLDVAVSGARGHDSAFRAALKVAHGFDLDESAAMRVLSTWNARCRPPWSDAELRHKIRDAVSKSHAVERGAMLRERATEPAREVAAPLASRIVSVDAAWIAEAPPPRVYLARDKRTGRGSLGSQGVALLVAAGGAGKSYATIGLAVAVATGGAWLGVMQVERAGRVLLASAEDSADEIRPRVYHQARASHVHAIPAGAIDVLDVHDVHMPLLDADGRPTVHVAALIDLVRARGPFALVILDPLARVAGASIDGDNVAAGALVGVLEALSTAAGGLVIGVHHTSLTARRAGTVDATAIRGATGIGDAARMVMVLGVDRVEHGDSDAYERLGEIVTLHAAKANHVRKWEPIELRRGAHGELLPLDEVDRQTVAAARHTATPSVAKREARGAERAAKHADDEARRAAARAARERAAADRDAEVDAAVVAVVHDVPGIGATDLRAKVRARAQCGADVADVAIARMLDRGRVRREGTVRAAHHFEVT